MPPHPGRRVLPAPGRTGRRAALHHSLPPSGFGRSRRRPSAQMPAGPVRAGPSQPPLLRYRGRLRPLCRGLLSLRSPYWGPQEPLSQGQCRAAAACRPARCWGRRRPGYSDTGWGAYCICCSPYPASPTDCRLCRKYIDKCGRSSRCKRTAPYPAPGYPLEHWGLAHTWWWAPLCQRRCSWGWRRCHRGWYHRSSHSNTGSRWSHSCWSRS